jgi:hypothetical protein
VSEWTALSDCLLGIRIAGREPREESWWRNGMGRERQKDGISRLIGQQQDSVRE